MTEMRILIGIAAAAWLGISGADRMAQACGLRLFYLAE